MKHYLDLVPVSARVHRRQSRLTRLCIVLSVFLIAGIFGMADMEIRSMTQRTVLEQGAWHAMFPGLTERQQSLIAQRAEVETSSRYAVTNYDLNLNYTVDGVKTGICGFDETMLALFPALEIEDGVFPQTAAEALATRDMKIQLGLSVGDTITLETPDGPLAVTLSGFTGSNLLLPQSGAYALFFNIEGYASHFLPDTNAEDFVLYVAFSPFCRIPQAIDEICAVYGLDESQVGQNIQLLTLTLQTDDSAMARLYLIAAVLAVLVVVAGILMIAGSLNSNVAQRTEFFGMLRCLGATPKQVKRLVRREALHLCVGAIPVGLALSVVMIWALCAVLRWASDFYFGDMPVFSVSWVSLVCGTVIGLVTVLLAARAPARRAARVAPLTAVSGNAAPGTACHKAVRGGQLPVEIKLGMHHALHSRKNFLLMTGSFAFSIILFLSFSPTLDFMQSAIKPLQPYTPDASVLSKDNSCTVPKVLAQQIGALPFVERAFGRSFAYDLPAQVACTETSVMLVSFEESQFGWAEDMVKEGDVQAARDGVGVLLLDKEGSGYQTGDTVVFDTPQGEKMFPVAATLNYTPFATSSDTIICSESLFTAITGQNDYTIIDVQLRHGKTDEQVEQIRQLAGSAYAFSNRLLSNSEVRGTYYAFALFFYGFLALIALITVLNIVNSISMSVSARMKQYGAMRAVGMSGRQLLRMVAAEAMTYVCYGILVGCAVGLPLNRFSFENMVTPRWGSAWYMPWGALGVILMVMLLAAWLAIRSPSKRIRAMSIVDTIGAQ
ncbi:ABC transporter permease [Candidatus Agathobaculum pullicola]|uniref:ABC transporter permease n=1 Tax=Candidatus Agathobaculum pullicola TaxID=2838426 RepID=UPI003F8DBF9E